MASARPSAPVPPQTRTRPSRSSVALCASRGPASGRPHGSARRRSARTAAAPDRGRSLPPRARRRRAGGSRCGRRAGRPSRRSGGNVQGRRSRPRAGRPSPRRRSRRPSARGRRRDAWPCARRAGRSTPGRRGSRCRARTAPCSRWRCCSRGDAAAGHEHAAAGQRGRGVRGALLAHARDGTHRKRGLRTGRRGPRRADRDRRPRRLGRGALRDRRPRRLAAPAAAGEGQRGDRREPVRPHRRLGSSRMESRSSSSAAHSRVAGLFA